MVVIEASALLHLKVSIDTQRNALFLAAKQKMIPPAPGAAGCEGGDPLVQRRHGIEPH